MSNRMLHLCKKSCQVWVKSQSFLDLLGADSCYLLTYLLSVLRVPSRETAQRTSTKGASSKQRDFMAGLGCQLLSLLCILGVLQLARGYSFRNCIEESKGQLYKCIKRKERNMKAIVDDLPPTTVSLIITVNPVSYIPNNTFSGLPNLQFLRLDHNHLKDIGQLAFQNLTQLKSLNLSFNFISVLRPSVFNDLGNLTFLSLANNILKELPGGIFSTLFSLSNLIIRENFLRNFTRIAELVSDLTNLSKLDLCLNKLTSLSHVNVSLPNSLTVLYVSGNNLSTLGNHSSLLKPIQVLDLSNNSRLSAEAFHGVDLRGVHYLSLKSTGVNIFKFLEISNIYAGHIDFSWIRLNRESMVVKLCKILGEKLQWIKNLDLGHNEFQIANSSMLLKDCPKITGYLNMSHNQIKSVNCFDFLQSQEQVRVISVEHNHIHFLPPCAKAAPLPKLKEAYFRYSHIQSVSSFAFNNTPNLKILNLNINSISFINEKGLRGLYGLETLRLDNNLLTLLNRYTFEDLISLKTLNLRNNRISVIFRETFYRLGNLTTLDLGGNKITHFEQTGLDGLRHLEKFYLDGNNLKKIDPSFHHIFQDTLTVLDLENNQITFLSEWLLHPPFINFTKLSDLKLGGQRPHGLAWLPPALFRGLHSLKSLYLADNKITLFGDNVFDDLTGLNFLSMDSCCVGVMQFQPGIFKNLKNLTTLTLENTGIQNFSKEVFGSLTKLRKLQLNRNVMQQIDVEALQSLPNLQYLDIRNVPLSCACQNSMLKNWAEHNQDVQVVYLYNMSCPGDAKAKFYKFDTRVCYKDLGKYAFLGTSLVIFLFTFTPLFYVKLYWKFKYGYYVFRSWFSEQWRRIREEKENCKYDAFISYNSSDEKWVMDQLLPNLEGKGSSFKLCLHHRDFEPGRYILDNIVSAVYSSRKTICVVSRNFLRSEWCSLEIQLASYRLFDEHRDVLLLVLLEPLSDRQLSSYHRMRKVMLKKTYLQWPGTECIDPAQSQELFWNQLRRAIGTGSRTEREGGDTSEDCAAHTQGSQHFETQIK